MYETRLKEIKDSQNNNDKNEAMYLKQKITNFYDKH